MTGISGTVSVSSDVVALSRAGRDALRRGNAEEARETFRRATQLVPTDIAAWLGLAQATRLLKDQVAAGSCVERALAIDPRSTRALVLRADLYAEEGNARAASSFYAAALRYASPSARHDPELAGELARAQSMCERYARDYENFLHERLAAAGFDSLHSSARAAQSLDLLTGRKQLYLQQPSQFYFPGLPQIQFYDRAQFPWLAAVERATEDIAQELQAILPDETAFKPYVEKVPNRPRPDTVAMTDNRDWTAFYLWKNGELVPENAARFPKTLAALEGVPLCRVPGRTPSILFSRLRPGAHIPAHHGFINARLICHLPLVIPDNCRFRVGNDVRAWEKGKAFVFDDTIEHEAWNDSEEVRIVLLFEVWRPELTEEERGFVSTLLQALGSYGGQQGSWSA